MTQRRSLVDGLQDTPDLGEIEKQFVYGEKAAPQPAQTPEPQATKESSEQVMPQYKGRVPLTTRCRPELASAIKRVSLQRQLTGQEPSRIQDIIEQALEQWLANNA